MNYFKYKKSNKDEKSSSSSHPGKTQSYEQQGWHVNQCIVENGVPLITCNRIIEEIVYRIFV